MSELATIDHETGEIIQAPVTLFGTNEPEKVIEQATRSATALAEVIKRQKLTSTIQGRAHVLVDGWTLLGSMVGVFPVCIWTRKMSDPEGWEARVEARTRTGEVVGAAEAQCTRSENAWGYEPTGRDGRKLQPRDDFALRSMAQTRATSKALRQPLGFVMQLAGFEATPAEEMPAAEASDSSGDKRTQPQNRKVFALIKDLETLQAKPWPPHADWKTAIEARCGELWNHGLADITKTEASTLIEDLTAYVKQLTDSPPTPESGFQAPESSDNALFGEEDQVPF